jgi:hypothetical protein
MNVLRDLQAKLGRIWPHLNERSRRMVAAAEARELGYGGVSLVSRACGLSRVTITKGLRELDAAPLSADRIRRVGGGRHRLEVGDPDLPAALEALVEPLTRGDPESPLRWTCKSTRTLAGELARQHHPVSHQKVAQYLHQMGYSLQGNRKTEEGEDHPDRDAQFRHINREVKRALAAGWPVISVDTKKKELIGNYENRGRQWRRARSAEHDTATFAVASVRGWWRQEGRRLYPAATHLLITADAGGRNGYRLRLWKVELQGLADQTGLVIGVCHFPPGTSKWNKVEHRLFSFISSNWRREPLRDYETVVRLIAATTTAKGRKVSCRLDRRAYPARRKISDDEMATLNITPLRFHGEWNYTIHPRRQ